MNIVLMAVGLLVAAAGFVTIGFGIPINAFSLGNTLILSGTIAVTSGFILIALSVLIGHLRRIADGLKGRPVRMGHAAEPFAPPQVAAPVAVGAPAVRMAPPMPEPAPAAVQDLPPEPRFPAPASSEPPGPLDWLRAKSRTAGGGAPQHPVEPPVVEIPDEAPLSPRPPQRAEPAQRPAMPLPPEPALDPKSLDTRSWVPGRPAANPFDPRVAPPMPRTAPQPEPPKERERFDLVWPDRPLPMPPAPAPAPQPAPQSAPQVSSEPPRREAAPAPEMPLPPIPAKPRDSRPAGRERRIDPPRAAAERGPAILKSGVIDGMPYTLYADGSIEADLPTGTVKFASVDALRAHLEKQHG
jgi:hypothetical protein